MQLLEVQNLKLSYKNKSLLQLPAFFLRKGFVSGIIGESGSGKSLFLLALMGLLPQGIQAEGIMKLNHNETDLDLLMMNDTERRKLMARSLGMVFQEPMSALNPRIKCGEQIAEVFETHSEFNSEEIKQKVLDSMFECGLEDLDRIYNSFPFQISGGQRQRVMIAMATALKPGIVLADEPTTALDPKTGSEVLNTLVQRCRKLGSLLILVSHDLKSVAAFADDITVLRGGKLIAQGSTADVLKNQVHPYVQELLQAGERRKRILKSRNAVQNLKITDLTKSYGNGKRKKEVFRNLNIALLSGETLTILGKSGSGKSTLAKVLTGLEKPDSGDVMYGGKTIFNNKTTGIQMVFQDPYSSLNNEMKCGEIVAEVLRVKLGKSHSDARKQTLELLESVGLTPDFADRYPHQLSGGQRQRLCIARALASEPEVLILDEAVAALDPLVQKQVLDLLEKIQDERGLIYLFITHDHKIAESFGHKTLDFD